MFPTVHITVSYLDQVASNLLVTGQLGRLQVQFMVDTGSMVTIVSLDTVHRTGLIDYLDQNVRMHINQEVNEYFPTILGQLRVPLVLGDYGQVIVQPLIAVMDYTPFNILGMDVLAHYGCILNLPPLKPSLTFTQTSTTSSPPVSSVRLPCWLFTSSTGITMTEAMIDTGCSITLLPLGLVTRLGMEHLVEPDDTTAVTITGAATCEGVIRDVQLHIMDQIIVEDMLVFDKFNCILLGLPGIIKLGVSVKFT
ncbi:unnamed protein product, partial [Meganyctiphanes norvegica]